ncbi:hypothetical protein CPA10_17545 [Xanthomonas citri pv. citri]|nr:hypothetical protein CLM98_18180 [Xanthomonas citri pv. citri]AYL21950.1 hypothetical protein COR42_17590 [Xanthomonas citri pv. citri]AYL26377.1 hypothetical protein CPA10_17545 [Xanthomonas citri pv. citri]
MSEGIRFSSLAILPPFLVEAFVLPIRRLDFLLQLAQRAHGLFQEQGTTRVCGAAFLCWGRLSALVFRVLCTHGRAAHRTGFQGLLVCLREVRCWQQSRFLIGMRRV